MSGTMWRDGGTKKFQLGKGGDKIEYLFTAALAIIIVGSVVLTVYFTVFKPKGGVGELPAWHYECEKCQNVFDVTPASHPELLEADDAKGRRMDCPKCGGKKTAWQMAQCPACDKYYVKPSDKLRTGKPDICPFCKANYLDALRTKVENMK